MPLPEKPLMARPRTVTSAFDVGKTADDPSVSPSAPGPASEPSSSTSGEPAYPGCVVASTTALKLMGGSGDSGEMVWTPAPGMSKRIWCGANGVVLASVMASRSDPDPRSAVDLTVKNGEQHAGLQHLRPAGRADDRRDVAPRTSRR